MFVASSAHAIAQMIHVESIPPDKRRRAEHPAHMRMHGTLEQARDAARTIRTSRARRGRREWRLVRRFAMADAKDVHRLDLLDALEARRAVLEELTVDEVTPITDQLGRVS